MQTNLLADTCLKTLDTSSVSDKKEVCLVVACTLKDGIGKNGDLPWPRLSEDLKHLNRVTTSVKNSKLINAVIMGRKTYESLPSFMRPLKNRLNLIVTSQDANTFTQSNPNVLVASDVTEAVNKLQEQPGVERIFVLGGERIYTESLEKDLVDRAYVTRVAIDPWECDTKFPSHLLNSWETAHVGKTVVENGVPYDFIELLNARTAKDLKEQHSEDSIFAIQPKSHLMLNQFATLQTDLHEEYQYLNLIEKIIAKGVQQDDRTGVGTVNLFGEIMRFDLRKSFPLLTTKRVFWKGVAEELLWFVKGDTNANNLAAKGVKIWDGNGSREFLDSRGLSHREVGDLGPVYGFQWRHFGAKYEDMHSEYTGKGVDQLMDCINKIKHNPTDRRIIMSAWNPADLHLMALPPCHMFCQFYVENGELSCAMYQRSCDMGLGVPFNIASYSLLTCMMAQVCGLKPGWFVHNLGNAHVYLNHVEPLKEQLKRAPKSFPILRINPDVKDIDGFQMSDFELVGYNPWGKIDMQMAV